MNKVTLRLERERYRGLLKPRYALLENGTYTVTTCRIDLDIAYTSTLVFFFQHLLTGFNVGRD